MSRKVDKGKNAFTITGMYTISITRVHVCVWVVFAILSLSLVLGDEALVSYIEWLTEMVLPTPSN